MCLALRGRLRQWRNGRPFRIWASSLGGGSSFPSFTNVSAKALTTSSKTGRVLWYNPQTRLVSTWQFDAQTCGAEATPVATTSSDDWEIQATGDLDGDGQADILWQHRGTRALGVWLLNGNSVKSGASLPTPGPGWSVAGLADFDADRQADVLWRREQDQLLAYWKLDHLSIAGTRALGLPPQDGQWTLRGAAALTRDGAADLLWFDSATRKIRIANWTVAGFAENIEVGSVPVGYEPRCCQDFDGDGQPDLLCFNAATRETAFIRLLENSAADLVVLGTAKEPWQLKGSLAAIRGALVHSGEFGSYLVHFSGKVGGSLAQGDFNGDGHQDIASVTGDQPTEVNLFFGGPVMGQFSERTVSLPGYFSTQAQVPFRADVVKSADFNNDGKTDLLVHLYDPSLYVVDDRLLLLMNDGQGNFINQSTVVRSTTDYFREPQVGDYNGDGLVDVAFLVGKTYYGSGELQLAYGDGRGNFNLGPRSGLWSLDFLQQCLLTDGPTSDLLLLGSTRVSLLVDPSTLITPVLLGQMRTAAQLDVNRDGRPDVILADGNASTLSTQNADGRFSSTDGPFGAIQLVSGDFNGDQWPDIAGWVGSEIKFGWNAAGRFGNVLSLPVPSNGYGVFRTFPGDPRATRQSGSLAQILACDLNGDKFSELLYSVPFFGLFTFPGNCQPAPNRPRIIIPRAFDSEIGDLNGDGQVDFLVQDYSGDLVVYLAGNQGYQRGWSTSLAAGDRILAVVDIDGDGKLDVILRPATPGPLHWFKGLGNGVFAAQTPVTVGIFQGWAASVGDVNGDGLVDIITFYERDARVVLNQGGGIFGAPILSVGITAAGQNQTMIDVDGDGKVDIVSHNYGQATYSRGNGDGTFASATSMPANPACFGDFDGDGKLDFLPRGDTVLYRGDGAGHFTRGATLTATPFVGGFAADVNGDGRLDLIETDVVRVRLNTTSGMTDRRYLGLSSTTVRKVHLADVTGDGLVDLVINDSVLSVLPGIAR